MSENHRRWDAHNREGVSGWVVAPLHSSGDGSHYAPITQKLTEEDARLIAASPELLAACEEALLWFCEWEEDNTDKHSRHASNPLRAAIAKAKGAA